MPDFARRRHGHKGFIPASSTFAQSYPSCIQICPSGYERSSQQRYASSGESDLYWSQLHAISIGMADLSLEESTEKSRVIGPERLPTPCPSDSEDKSQRSSGKPETNTPVSPALPALTESAGSLRLTSSSSMSGSPLEEFEMPPTPRLRTCQLPMSPSMVISPLPLLPPLHSDSPSNSPPNPREHEFDPLDEHPLLRPLAEDWSSLDRNTSLSLAAEPPEEEPWPFSNALGLYVDPAMNVTTWDAGGFIRSTAPSRSPLRFRRYRQRI